MVRYRSRKGGFPAHPADSVSAGEQKGFVMSNYEAYCADGVIAEIYMASEPVVRLKNIPGMPGTHEYLGRVFLEGLARNGLTVAPMFDDQDMYTLTVGDVQLIVNAIRKLIAEAMEGEYRVHWVSTKNFPY